MARMDELDKSTTTNHHMLGCNSRTCHFARMTLRISSICLKAYPTPPTTKPPWDTLYSDVAQWLEPPSYKGRPEFDFSASLPTMPISQEVKAIDFDSIILVFESRMGIQGLRPLNFSPAYESLKRSFMNFDMRQQWRIWRSSPIGRRHSTQNADSFGSSPKCATTSSTASRQKL